MADNADKSLLNVNGVRKYFAVTRGVIFAKVLGQVQAVDGVSFQVKNGETYSLVGESGCGKTTTAKMVLRQERPTAGSITVDGANIHAVRGNKLRAYRRSVQAVFQDPYNSLNPRMRVGHIISEPLEVNKKVTKAEVREEVQRLLQTVGLNPHSGSLFPHEFSGGQRQRIAVARALSLRPKLMVLDEPVSALDVSIRAQIMNLLKELQEEHGLAYLLIAHDLGVVRHMSHNIGVMYLGKLVEETNSEELYDNPLHPYTQALLYAAAPFLPGVERKGYTVSGEVPSPLNPPTGCRFHTRCPFVMPRCSQEEPPLTEVAPGHKVACFLHSEETAAAVEEKIKTPTAPKEKGESGVTT